MIAPDCDDLLSAALDTLQSYVLPAVDDEYAHSLGLTVCQLLRTVRARVPREGEALDEDNRELRALLEQLLPQLPPETRDATSSVLAAPQEQGYPSVARLTRESLRLRAALCAVIPETDDGAVDAYLGRHLERQRPWLVDAFEGPRR